MSFTAKDVKALRDATGAGMMDAKKALDAADGDMEAAKQALREKGLAKADARSDRDNDEGTVAIAVDGNTAAVVQIKTETDFSAKNNAVTTLAQTLADAVLTGGPGAVDSHADAIDDLKVEKPSLTSLDSGITTILIQPCSGGRGPHENNRNKRDRSL